MTAAERPGHRPAKARGRGRRGRRGGPGRQAPSEVGDQSDLDWGLTALEMPEDMELLAEHE